MPDVNELTYLQSQPSSKRCPKCGRFMRKLGLISVVRIHADGGGLRSHICKLGEYDYATHKWSHDNEPEKPSQIGWRACVGSANKTGGYTVRPLYPSGTTQPATVGDILKGTHHVGTTREFVIDHYAEITELGANEFELLLELECTQIQEDHQDRWGYPAATEALVTDPMILTITVIATGPRE